jgi:uncharacterized Zn finger protein
MGWYDWDRPKPRRPANGIKAQTQDGRFGKTWWAGRWIAALERIVDSARLSRGRSYARSGQVVSLEVGRGGVKALVQGSRPKPYKVSIGFKRLTDPEWEQVVEAMSVEAIYAAQLLSGEMPEDVEKVFETAGVNLFPTNRGDLETDCSCPDWANPCKHVAAVHYLLGERFDADPFLMFELRGRSKDEITSALRAKRAPGQEASPGGEEAAADEVEQATPLAQSLDAYWSAPEGLPDLVLSFVAPPVDALPTKRLGQPAYWRGKGDFQEIMEGAYRAVGARAYRIAMGDSPA